MAHKTYPGSPLGILSSLTCWVECKGYNRALCCPKEWWTLDTERTRAPEQLCGASPSPNGTRFEWAFPVLSLKTESWYVAYPDQSILAGISESTQIAVFLIPDPPHLLIEFVLLQKAFEYIIPVPDFSYNSIRKFNISGPQFTHLWNDG